MNLGSFGEDDEGEEKESQHVQPWRSASCFIIGLGAEGLQKDSRKAQPQGGLLGFCSVSEKEIKRRQSLFSVPEQRTALGTHG